MIKGPLLKALLRALLAAGVVSARVVPLFAQTIPSGPPVSGRIVRFDPRLDQLIPPGAVVETIVTGRQWTEGPVWDRRDGSLLFSDVPANVILRWRPGQGTSIVREQSGYSGAAPFTGREPGSNGLAFDQQGRLTVAQHGDRRVVRVEPSGAVTVLVDRFEGKRLNSPNDHVWAPDGSLLLTDPPFGLPATFHDPGKELPFSGVYRVRPDGRVELLTKELAGPNGLAVAPDGRSLIVSNNDPNRPMWIRYPFAAAGPLGPGSVLFDAGPWTQRAPGLPDGLKLDRAGNLFGAGPGGVYVIAPNGTLLGLIETGVATGNVAWGEDGATLFIAANTEVKRLRTSTLGAGW